MHKKRIVLGFIMLILLVIFVKTVVSIYSSGIITTTAEEAMTTADFGGTTYFILEAQILCKKLYSGGSSAETSDGTAQLFEGIVTKKVIFTDSKQVCSAQSGSSLHALHYNGYFYTNDDFDSKFLSNNILAVFPDLFFFCDSGFKIQITDGELQQDPFSKRHIILDFPNNEVGVSDENIRNFLYEGECNLYVRADAYLSIAYQVFPAEIEHSEDAFSLVSPYMFGELDGMDGPYFFKAEEYKYNVDWDSKSDNCIGEYNDFFDCCGDDYLWIMNGYNDYNKATSYDTLSFSDVPSIACLYDYGTITPLYPPNPKQYKCDAVAGTKNHKRYDPVLMGYDTENTEEKRRLFAYQNNLDYTTDVGLWFKEDKGYAFCHHYFDNGDKFEWLSQDAAGEIHLFNEVNSDNVPVSPLALHTLAPDYIYENTDSFAQAPASTSAQSDTVQAAALTSDDYSICNLFLDGEWTGHHCCGHKNQGAHGYDIPSYHDTAEDGMHSVVDAASLINYHLSMAYPVPNKACYRGKAVGHLEAITSQSQIIKYAAEHEMGPIDVVNTIDTISDIRKDILSFKGKLYLCSLEQEKNDPDYPEFKIMEWDFQTNNPSNTPLFKLGEPAENGLQDVSASVKEACAFFSDEETSMAAYCSPKGSWVIEEYSEEAAIHSSALPAGISADLIDTRIGCCSDDKCWAGADSGCVDADENLYVKDGEIITDEAEAQMAYVCRDGQWKAAKKKYDWYGEKGSAEETTAAFCVDEWSCACPLDFYDEDIDSLCRDYYDDESRCTIEPFTFVNDHLCQPYYISADAAGADSSAEAATETVGDKIINADWSTRTKIIALQLLKYISSMDEKTQDNVLNPHDYILYCDTPKNALNYFVDFAAIPDLFTDETFVNNFCVLRDLTDQRIFLATTLNALAGLFDEEMVDWESDGQNEGAAEETEETISDFILSLLDFDVKKLLTGEDRMGITDSEHIFSSSEASCSSVIDVSKEGYFGRFMNCQNSDFYYNDKLKAVIYSPGSSGNPTTFEPIGSYSEEDVGLLMALSLNLDAPIENIPESSFLFFEALAADIHRYKTAHIENLESGQAGLLPQGVLDIVSAISDFNTVYIAKKGDAGVYGVLERKDFPDGFPATPQYFFAVKYVNVFYDNINCSLISNSPKAELISCSQKDASRSYVYSVPRETYFENVNQDENLASSSYVVDDNINKYWQSLTSKLRFK